MTTRVLAASLLVLACGASARQADPAGRLAPPPPRTAAAAPLGIGRPATPEEIARVHIDVRPDGHGLPPGAGTPREGERVYAAKCAACHGIDGLGMPGLGSALIGAPRDRFDFALSLRAESQKTIGTYWPYATTVFDYVRRAMPLNAPGSLSDGEVYRVTAFLLWKNRVIGEDTAMDATSLPAVRMPAQPHFVPDDRTLSHRVR